MSGLIRTRQVRPPSQNSGFRQVVPSGRVNNASADVSVYGFVYVPEACQARWYEQGLWANSHIARICRQSSNPLRSSRGAM